MSGRVDPVYKPTATFLSGTSVSSSIDMSKLSADGLAIQIPSAWTAADIGFQGSDDDSTWVTLYDKSGTGVKITGIATAATGIYVAPGSVSGILQYKYLRLVSRNTSVFATAVNQGADRVVTVFTLEEAIPNEGGTTTISGTATTAGNLTNNNAAPAATNMGVLGAIASAAQKLWTEGNQVLASVDLAGFLRITQYKFLSQVTLTLDTSAYAANDVLSDAIVITNFFPVADGVMWLDQLTILDEDNQTAYDIRAFLLGANVSLGTKNAAVSISDADARNIQSVIEVPLASAIALTNSKVYPASFSPRKVKAVSGTRDLYIQLQVGATGTPTHTASGIRLWVGGYA